MSNLAPKKSMPLESRLRQAAEWFRGNEELGEHKHIVLRPVFRRLLAKFRYPPDLKKKAVELALVQSALSAGAEIGGDG